MTEREALEGVVAAWEALPGPRNYATWEVQQWMINDMAPAINKARAALSHNRDASETKDATES